MAKEEAASIGSPHIEAEHLLLGVARAVEPDLKELLRLKELEDTLRADLRDLPSWMDKADVGTVAVLTLDNGERLTAEVRILMTSGTNSLLTFSPATALIRTTVSEAVRFLSAALSLLSPDNVRTTVAVLGSLPGHFLFICTLCLDDGAPSRPSGKRTCLPCLLPSPPAKRTYHVLTQPDISCANSTGHIMC